MRKFLNGVFVLILFALLFVGIGKAFYMPEEKNEYENRYAEQLQIPTKEGVLSGEYQNQTEAALGDQLLFAVQIKELYNNAVSSFNKFVLEKVKLLQSRAAEAVDKEKSVEPEEFKTIDDPNAAYYTLADGNQILKDHLMFKTRFLDGEKDRLDKRIANINASIEKYNTVDFYIYYIERETDINFVTGERSNIYEYIVEKLNLPADHCNRFFVNKFELFDRWFYKTDHHLTNAGAYLCYSNLLNWLLPEEEPMPHTGEYSIGYFSGSKATGTDTQAYKDIIRCYTFDYPEMITHENGKKINYYGAQEAYIQKRIKKGELLPSVKYSQLFGQDSGEVRFETPSKDTGSIMLIGSSMDNAFVRQLAAHFNKLYAVDLRNYSKHMNEKFNLKKYLKKHPDITKILIIGDIDSFVLEAFNLY